MSANVKRQSLGGAIAYLCRRLREIAIPLILIQVATAHPASVHHRHVFFDNSAADRSYFFGEAAVVAPSELEIVNGKLPVETAHFKSPPNSLRLNWKSASGGDWHVTLKAPDRYVRDHRFDGDTLSLWCFSEKELEPGDAPKVFVQDSTGAGVTTIALLANRGSLPAGKWTEVRLPFSKFAGPYQSTQDSKFGSRRLSKITFVQNLDNAHEHILYIDDITVI